MLGLRKQQCLALLAAALLFSAATAQDVEIAARKEGQGGQRAGARKNQVPHAPAKPATPVAPKVCGTKLPNQCICKAGSCSGCEACEGCPDTMCVAAPSGYTPVSIQSSYNPTETVTQLPPQLLSEIKTPKPRPAATNTRTLLQAATPQWGTDYGLICDGQLREVVVPVAPYPDQSPYNNPYNNPPGLTCTRPAGGYCGAQAKVDCDDTYESFARGAKGNVIKNIGPVNQNGDGTFVISPLNPLQFYVDPQLAGYLTFVEWTVYDVGPGGAKLAGNYGPGGGLQPDVNSYSWVPNGKQTSSDGHSQYCATCTSCTVGQGVTNMTLNARPGTGYSAIEISQLYTDASCGATCVNLDGIYWTGMKYKCVKPTCKDTDLSQMGNQNYQCPANYVYNPAAAANTTLSADSCCKFAPTCGNTDPMVPGKFYPCSAQGCLDPPFEDQCWTNKESAKNVPLTGNSATDLINCCNQPTAKTSAGDVYVTKIANQPVQQVVGSTFTFVIQVGVNGLADAICQDVKLTDTMPKGLVIDSIVEDPFQNACSTPSQTSFKCQWDYILKKEVKKITLKVTANTAGEFLNVARVSSPNDTNPDNNEASDKVRALGACCDRLGPRCTNTLPEDCKAPKIFTKDKPCSAVDCVPIPEDEGSCCLPTFGQCVDRTKQSACEDAGGRWTRGKLCSNTPNCKPPRGACCNVKSGACYENRTLTECELEISTWKKDGSCTSDGYCSGSCCDTTSGSCIQSMKKDCMKPGSVWSIYQQCNILTCPKDNQCIPPWWQCRPPLYGQQDPCCPGYSCQHSYKKCKAGEWICKPKTPEPQCVPEYHSCGGFSNGVCCTGLTCMWDHKRHKGTCMKYTPDNCAPDGGSCRKDSDCMRGSRCAYGKCKPCGRDSCYRDCFDYKCFEERKKDCNVFYSTAASL